MLTLPCIQAFHNYDPTCDIFNHSNLIYWQISLPGLDGWNNVSCTGTNFVVRARAAQEVCCLSPTSIRSMSAATSHQCFCVHAAYVACTSCSVS